MNKLFKYLRFYKRCQRIKRKLLLGIGENAIVLNGFATMFPRSGREFGLAWVLRNNYRVANLVGHKRWDRVKV